jgi:undecaprenyl phosphate-alpha-L-ara4FN deformylase
MGKVRRTSVVKHYGYKTLLYGTVLPGPDIGKECADILRSVRDSGFEPGIHTYDHVRWQDSVAHEEALWTRREMELSCERFRDIFGTDAKIHGAAGWQMNRHAFRLTQLLGFDYCSDTRGTRPFVPVQNAEVIACPQLPTTLPTLDELIGLDGIDEHNVVNRILDATKTSPPNGHVYTLHAELEGMRMAPTFEALLRGWKDQGYQLASLSEYFEWLPEKNLPRHEVVASEIPGRAGSLMVQGREFLAPLPAEALIRPHIN